MSIQFQKRTREFQKKPGSFDSQGKLSITVKRTSFVVSKVCVSLALDVFLYNSIYDLIMLTVYESTCLNIFASMYHHLVYVPDKEDWYANKSTAHLMQLSYITQVGIAVFQFIFEQDQMGSKRHNFSVLRKCSFQGTFYFIRATTDCITQNIHRVPCMQLRLEQTCSCLQNSK